MQYDDDDDEYEEYEVIELPLWKKVVNEVRIPLFVFVLVLLIFNCNFDKFLLSKVPKLGNQFNDCNLLGTLLKAFIVSIISYILIRFIKL